MLSFLLQQLHGGGVTLIVKPYQNIIQHQRCLRGQFFCYRQPQGQIQLIHRALTAPLDAADGGVRLGSGVDGQILLQLQPIVAAISQRGEQLPGLFGDPRRKSALQLIGGVCQCLLRQFQSVVVAIQLLNTSVDGTQLMLQPQGTAQGFHSSLMLAQQSLQLLLLKIKIRQGSAALIL